MARDYQVRIKSREGIAEIAMSQWLEANKLGHSFNICTFVTDVLSKKLRNKGSLCLRFYKSEQELPDRACVSFDPLTLHIVEKIWHDANLGVPYARHILAHEIGHIVLHDKFAVAFSADKSSQLRFLQDEESGEWQANTFADYFLVPDHIAVRLQQVDLVAGLCVVDDELAGRRLRDAAAAKRILLPPYEGEICSDCNNFTLARNGTSMKCDTCGSTKYS